MSDQPKKFKDLLLELEDIVKKFETNQIDLEEGIEKYKSAQEIIGNLKKQIEEAKNEIKELTKE